MKYILYLSIICTLFSTSCETNSIPEDLNKNEKFPYLEEIYGSMYGELMMSEAFEDTKLFADAVPINPVKEIRLNYRKRKNDVGFDHLTFMKENWTFPDVVADKDTTAQWSIDEHIDTSWSKLTISSGNKDKNGSYIELPHPHVVSDARDRDINYWESYFIIEGLLADGKIDLAKGMIDNFKYLIDEFGYIPQGNRTYLITRSAQPVFTDMVSRYIIVSGEDVWSEYIPAIEKEYEFWMRGSEHLIDDKAESEHLLRVTKDIIANRYFDSKHGPRAEHYFHDQHRGGYRYIRAASESGWGRCARYMRRPDRFYSLDVPYFAPIDLNATMYNMEKFLYDYHQKNENSEKTKKYKAALDVREAFFHEISWSDSLGVFFDYRMSGKKPLENTNFKPFERYTAAMLYPLFYNIATKEQADKVVTYTKANLIFSGGIATSTENTNFSWDGDWGHPALQWIAVKALDNYGYKSEAKQLAQNWIALNEKVYTNTGKMLDKYEVKNMNIESGGAKYDRHDGYGVTNGVYLALKNYIGDE